MYIKKNDFSYFETLNKGLDESKRKKFLDTLLKEGARKSGEDIAKIQVVGDEVFDKRAIDQKEFITKTMIRKAYKAAKGE